MGVKTRGSIVISLGETFRKVFKFRTNGGVDPVDFRTATEIQFSFLKADGTYHIATLTAYDADDAPDSNGQVTLDQDSEGTDGNVTVELPEAVTALLKEGEAQDIGVAWEIGGDRTETRLQRVLEVTDGVIQ